MQMENLTFLRQKVIFNAQPLHGFQMAANNGRGNQLADLSRFIAATLNVMQRLQTKLQVLLILFIPLRNSRIEVPAVIVKRMRRRPGSRDQLLDLALPFFSRYKKPTTTSATWTPVLSI